MASEACVIEAQIWGDRPEVASDEHQPAGSTQHRTGTSRKPRHRASGRGSCGLLWIFPLSGVSAKLRILRLLCLSFWSSSSITLVDSFGHSALMDLCQPPPRVDPTEERLGRN